MNLRYLGNRSLRIRRILDRLALPLGFAGLVAVAAYNWRQWQRDKERLAQVCQAPPLPPLEEWSQLPLVSVLVAAWNEAHFIERHIESFLALRYPHKELVLCAGGVDGAFDLARKYEGTMVKILEQLPGEGKQKALARSLPHTCGDIIFLTDADCLLDDDAFERTIHPLVSEAEQVATGGSSPLPYQLDNPFVLSQAASQLYSSAHMPQYLTGLLGRNCAVVRSLLESSSALAADAPTGTDYVTAKILLASGARIRHVPQSRIATYYPTTVGQYVKQQRRWLRNVVLHGRRFGAVDEVQASLRTSATGLVMLLLPPIGLLLAPWLLVVWTILAAHAFLARLRYLRFTAVQQRRSLRLADAAIQVPLLLLDFVAWTHPLNDYLRHRNRWSW